MTIFEFSRHALLPLALAGLAGAALAGEIVTPDGGRYTGALVNGLRQGQGQVAWDNGARYRGSFEAGLFSGPGRFEMPDGSIYTGEFRNGAFEGQGRLEQPGTYTYEGRFEKGQIHGRGRLDSQTAEYEGEFRQGTYWGKGELRYKDGRKYSGDFERNLFHGKGRYETADGEVFEGDFVQGEFTGTGTYAGRRGMRHEGAFVKWRTQGPGRLTDAGGVVYEGEFDASGLKQGRMSSPDGARYEGPFSDYRPHGQGVLRLANGDTYSGTFAYGVYDGPGTLTYARPQPDGRTQLSGVWRFGQLPDQEAERKAQAAVEAALYGQRALLDKALATVVPRAAEKINLYLLAVAGGEEEVFRREVDFVRQQFDSDFGTRGRSLALANSRNTLATAPMATLTSIRDSLQRFAGVMDKEKDILFLYLTSHGSPGHEFVLDQQHIGLPDLKAAELGRLLRDSGIRWKVVVISACYSGGFIDALRDDHTLVITAARHDRSSFGCSDENEFTYFGRAFFKESLPQSTSFQDAFGRAEKLIGQWESDDRQRATRKGNGIPGLAAAAPAAGQDYQSLPQMAGTKAVARQLETWWKQMMRTRREAGGPTP